MFVAPRRVSIPVVVALLAAGAVPAAHACSVCLCGDPVAASVGLQPPVRGTWTFTIENRSLSKSNALEADPSGTEFEHENRVTTSAAYALSDHVIVGATLPFLARSITENPPGERTRTTRFGDADLLARIDMGSRREPHSFQTLKLLLGATVPVGANNVTGEDGVRLDQHAQTGTGAWGGSVGIGGLTRGMQYWAYASSIVRAQTRNSQGYRYGSSLLVNAEVGRKMSRAVSLVVGVAGRTTGHDTNEEELVVPLGTPVVNAGDASVVEDSGGRVAYATPAIQFTLSPRASIRTEAQLPIWQDLHGTQDEDPNLIVRFTYSP